MVKVIAVALLAGLFVLALELLMEHQVNLIAAVLVFCTAGASMLWVRHNQQKTHRGP